jgi:hypothetical protein
MAHETMGQLGRVEERTEVDRFSKVNILDSWSTVLEHPGYAQSHRYLVLTMLGHARGAEQRCAMRFDFYLHASRGNRRSSWYRSAFSTPSDKMRIGDSLSRSTLFPAQLVGWLRGGMKICTR